LRLVALLLRLQLGLRLELRLSRFLAGSSKRGNGKLSVVDGVVQESNFDRYRMLRMSETPTFETHFSLAGGDMWGGIGEAAVGTVAPAVTNAIFKATGKRIRSLPIADHDLRRS
jgi:isoquinoline 1-oxidoreductase beta subunit